MNCISNRRASYIWRFSIAAGIFFFLLTGPAHSKEKRKIYKSHRLSLSLGTWISTGQTIWSHDASKIDSTLGNPTSELTYEDLDSNVFEVEAELRLPRRTFLRTRFGFGVFNEGRLIDDDFVSAAGATFFGATQTGAHRISRTSSNIDGDYMWYLDFDLGYKFWVSKNKRTFIKSFLGYQHWQEKVVATGVEQLECTAVGSFCNAAGTVTNVGQKAITNNVRWDSVRIGLEGAHWFNKWIRLDTQLVFIPYSSLLNEDIHHLRTDLKQDPSFKMNGTGIGYNLQAGIKFRFTKRLSFLAGYKYWRIEVKDGTWKNFPVVGSSSVVNLNEFISYRHGATAEIKYQF